MNYRTLGNTGMQVSELGFGASPLGNEFHPVEADDCARAVHCAIDSGINFFDVSPYYGRTLAEERLGSALRGRRHQVILATKCGRYGKDEFDFSAARVYRSIDESLTRLQTDYVDLWQAHDVEFGDLTQVIEETLPAMRAVQQQGKARFIGITGYQLRALRRVATEAGVDTVLSYCRYNLLIGDMERLLTPVVKETGTGLINASPLHMGVLTAEGPPSWHPAPSRVQTAGREAADLCRERGADLAAVALQYCLAHPYVAVILVGMASEEYVRRNVRAAEEKPDWDLISEIQLRVAHASDVTWPAGRPENEDYAENAANRRASTLLEIQRERV
jgi:L-galactose dehydrogenase